MRNLPNNKPIPDEKDVHPSESGTKWRQYLRAIGPGLIIGASDDDPSGIANYSQAGAQFGLGLLWSAYLGVQGLRPTQSGGHVVLAEAARAQLVPPLANLVNTFDRLRRQRNLVEYPPIGHEELTPDEVEDDADTVEEALDQIDKLLDVLPVF